MAEVILTCKTKENPAGEIIPFFPCIPAIPLLQCVAGGPAGCWGLRMVGDGMENTSLPPYTGLDPVISGPPKMS